MLERQVGGALCAYFCVGSHQYRRLDADETERIALFSQQVARHLSLARQIEALKQVDARRRRTIGPAFTDPPDHPELVAMYHEMIPRAERTRERRNLLAHDEAVLVTVSARGRWTCWTDGCGGVWLSLGGRMGHRGGMGAADGS